VNKSIAALKRTGIISQALELSKRQLAKSGNDKLSPWANVVPNDLFDHLFFLLVGEHSVMPPMSIGCPWVPMLHPIMDNGFARVDSWIELLAEGFSGSVRKDVSEYTLQHKLVLSIVAMK
jgi:hypothetical protein